MDQPMTQEQAKSHPPKLHDEFNSWPMNAAQQEAATDVRIALHNALETIQAVIPQHNARYLAIVRTHLEEAGFAAVKGIAKPIQT